MSTNKTPVVDGVGYMVMPEPMYGMPALFRSCGRHYEQVARFESADAAREFADWLNTVAVRYAENWKESGKNA